MAGSSEGASAEVTAPPTVAPEGTTRADFGAPGDHGVGFTRDVRPCDDLIYSLYEEILVGMNGVQSPPQCHGAFPNGTDSPVGVQYYWPTGGAGEAAAQAQGQVQGQAPLIVLSPGIGTEPGMLHRQAMHDASHGYVVALGYSLVNWFSYQLELAAKGAVEQANDPESPLYWPSDFGYASPAPTVPMLIAVAEQESMVPQPLSRIAWDRHAGPAWWTQVNGTYHGSYLDEPSYNAFGALVLGFADHATGRNDAATAVFEDVDGTAYRLSTDPELSGTERK